MSKNNINLGPTGSLNNDKSEGTWSSDDKYSSKPTDSPSNISVDARPVGPVGNLNDDPIFKKIKLFDLYMEELLKTCNLVISNYIENSDLIKSILIDLKLKAETDVDDKTVLMGFERF